MTNRPRRAAAKKRIPHRARPAEPRHQKKSLPDGAFSNVLAGLKALRERGGAAIGDVYARVARSVLVEVERFEDRSAERRYGHRSRAGSPSGAPVAQPSEKSLPPAK